MKQLFKKTVLITLIFILILTSAGGIFIKKAQAQLSSGEAIGKAIGAGAACFLEAKLESWAAGLLTRQIAVVEGYANLAEYPVAVPTVTLNNPAVAASGEASNALMKSKDCIRDVVAKILLDWITDETIRWIQGEGEPRFITDWENFAEDAVNVAVGEVISQTKLAGLCSPFKLQVQISLLPVQRFPQRIECTLDDVVKNIEDFFENFENGGWIAYNEAWQPQNNYFGLMIMAHDEMVIEAAKKKEAAINEGLASGGFLNQKRCVQYEQLPLDVYGPPKCLKYETVTPGSIIGDKAARALAADEEWIKNIKSWVAAITNAIINRLIKEGLSLMGASDEPVSGGDYDPYQGYDPIYDQRKQYRDDIVSKYQQLLADREKVLDYKKNSLSHSQQIVLLLNELKSRSCRPAVTDSEITAAEQEVERLQNEVNNLESIINEIDSNIAYAEGIDDDNSITDREIGLVEQTYNDFLAANSDWVNEVFINNTEDQQAANSESERKRTKRDELQTRLNICSQLQMF